MSNNGFSILIWLVNGLVALACLGFVYQFIVRGEETGASMPDSMDAVNAIAPQARPKLPWIGPVGVGEVGEVTPIREFASLFELNYNRIIPPPRVDTHRDPPPDPVKPDPPTAEEALAQLQSEVALAAVFYPQTACIVIASNGNTYSVVPGSNLTNSDLGLAVPATVIEILKREVLFSYVMTTRWRNEPPEAHEFELALSLPSAGGIDGVIDPESGVNAQNPIVSERPDPTEPRRVQGGAGPQRGQGGRDIPGSGSTGVIDQPRDGGDSDTEAPQETTFDADTGVWVISEDEANDVRTNYSDYLQEVTTRSVLNPETGQYEGVQLVNVPEQSRAAQRGFRTGDRVISINGTPVNTAADVRLYLVNHKDLPEYFVEFERDGRRQSRTYRVPAGN